MNKENKDKLKKLKSQLKQFKLESKTLNKEYYSISKNMEEQVQAIYSKNDVKLDQLNNQSIAIDNNIYKLEQEIDLLNIDANLINAVELLKTNGYKIYKTKTRK